MVTLSWNRAHLCMVKAVVIHLRVELNQLLIAGGGKEKERGRERGREGGREGGRERGREGGSGD